jgi:hypothetical protein
MLHFTTPGELVTLSVFVWCADVPRIMKAGRGSKADMKKLAIQHIHMISDNTRQQFSVLLSVLPDAPIPQAVCDDWDLTSFSWQPPVLSPAQCFADSDEEESFTGALTNMDIASSKMKATEKAKFQSSRPSKDKFQLHASNGKPRPHTAASPAWTHEWHPGFAVLHPSGDRVQMDNHPSTCEFGQYLANISMGAKVRVVDFFNSEEARELVMWLRRF